MTLKVTHRLQTFSHAIRRTFVQQFTRFQLTVCSYGSSGLAELLVNSSVKNGHNISTDVARRLVPLQSQSLLFGLQAWRSIRIHRLTKNNDPWFSLRRWWVHGRAIAYYQSKSIIISLKRDETVRLGWLIGGENFVSKRNQFILYAFIDF